MTQTQKTHVFVRPIAIEKKKIYFANIWVSAGVSGVRLMPALIHTFMFDTASTRYNKNILFLSPN